TPCRGRGDPHTRPRPAFQPASDLSGLLIDDDLAASWLEAAVIGVGWVGRAQVRDHELDPGGLLFQKCLVGLVQGANPLGQPPLFRAQLGRMIRLTITARGPGFLLLLGGPCRHLRLQGLGHLQEDGGPALPDRLLLPLQELLQPPETSGRPRGGKASNWTASPQPRGFPLHLPPAARRQPAYRTRFGRPSSRPPCPSRRGRCRLGSPSAAPHPSPP